MESLKNKAEESNFTLIQTAQGLALAPVVDALDLLMKPFSWDALKRSLRKEEVRIEGMAEELRVISTRSLEPEPIPIDLKVVMIGDPRVYYLLSQYDKDFREFFKVKVDFGTHTQWSDEKIEGFFEVCRLQGLTGKQGVLIPQSNVRNLLLKQEVVDAVAEGRFHVYAVSMIDEGLEILTGRSAGERRRDGTFPEDSVNGLARTKLHGLAEAARKFAAAATRSELTNA